jgi:hypothetical protein
LFDAGVGRARDDVAGTRVAQVPVSAGLSATMDTSVSPFGTAAGLGVPKIVQPSGLQADGARAGEAGLEVRH